MNWDHLKVSHTVQGVAETICSRVTYDPAVESSSPRGSQHDQTKSHDQGILDQTKSSSDPISLETDGDLSDHDTDDLEVVDGRDPIVVADSVVLPALRPDGLVQRRQVTDGEEATSQPWTDVAKL